MSRTAKKPALITIRELKGAQELASIYPLVKLHNRHITRALFDGILKEMLARGYRCIGAFDGRQLVGICGFWVGYRFWCHKFIDLDNVIVDEAARSRGIGQKMVAWVEKEAKKQGCNLAGLDSYTTAHAAHRFYFREGYSILGYHFTKRLD
jgi:GNAT superfamily N-acetyltransferase